MEFQELKDWVVNHLKKQLEGSEISKALQINEIISKATYPVGTIREWKGKKYIKTAPGKWQRKYDSSGRGLNQALQAVIRKAEKASTPEELYQIVMQNQSRFRDIEGRMLPEVQKLHDLVQKKQDKNKHFSSFVDEFIKKGYKSDKIATVMKETPKILKDCGVPDNPITITPTTIKKILNDENNVYHGHNIAVEVLKDLPNQLKNPVYVLKGKNGNKIVVTEHYVENRPIIAVIEINRRQGHINVNSVRTVYDKKNDVFAQWISDKSNIDYENKEKSQALLQSIGLQSTKEAASLGNVSIIPQSEGKSSGLESIKRKYNSSKSVEGDEDEIYVGGETIGGRWKLVEASAPSASHDEKTFQKTKGFPTAKDGGTINDRDYEHDKAAQEAVIDMAGDYDGRALSFDSPIVVTKDGVVISGNNRTMSSKIAARKGTDKKYIEALKKRAKKFGFTAEDVEGFKNPRVVFETDSNEPYSTEQFAKFNRSGKKAMDPIESAVKVSKMIKAETVEDVANEIGEFDTLGELYADKKATLKVFNALIDGGMVQKTDLPAYYTDSGITGAGKEFVETVMIGSVIDEKNIRQLNTEGAKSIRQKLVRAITPLIENKGMKGYSINKELNEAVQIAVEVAKNKDKYPNIEEFSKQQDLFRELDPVSVELAKKLEGTQKEFAAFMSGMNGGLRPAANGEGDIFFGGIETKEQIVNRFLGIKKSVQAILKKTFSWGLKDRVQAILWG